MAVGKPALLIELNSQDGHHPALRDADVALHSNFVNVGLTNSRGKGVEISDVEVALGAMMTFVIAVAVVTEGNLQ
jgi:hypothetical protein